MKRPLLISVLALASLSLMGSAFAQRAPMSGTFEGSGTFRRDSGRADLKRVEVVLASNGNAWVTFVANKRYQITGRWSSQGRDNFRVDIRSAMGDSNARGTVSIGMDGNRVERFQVSNLRAAGYRWSFDFRVSRWQSEPGWGVGNLNFSERARGEGSYRTPGARGQLTVLDSSWNRDGKFTLRTPQGNITGTYRRRSSQTSDLVIESAFGLRDVFGDGTVRFDGQRVVNLSIDGSSSRGAFRLEWVRSGSDSNPSRPDDGRSFEFRQTGSGEYIWDESRRTVREVEAFFDRSGRFVLRVIHSTREEMEVKGTWTRGDDNTLMFELTSVNGRSASGSGTLELDRNGRIDWFSFAGRNSSGRLSANFSCR